MNEGLFWHGWLEVRNDCERVHMKRLRLVVFDVDGTLIRINSSWRFLHQKLGTWERGSKYADQFFRGQISYEDWAKLDASLWKHTPLERIQKIIDNIPYTDGTFEVATLLKNEGLKVVLLSAGLSVVTDKVSREIGADDSYANELIVRDGFLTGEVKVNVSFENKDGVLCNILQKFGVASDECAAVGDDETMIPLFNSVGLGIAFNPRVETVEKQADIVVRGNDLRGVLPYLLAL